ncbi:arsenate reductase [Ferrimonas balearica]|uniref:arsenate reductase n=1 Tax=Ferrimonas balearica TaxID=44012 RepID=UPI001F2D622A|nr:arsenate reductase [Ferrimonas balearica]MBY6019674.1 arsenate reductase [Halomonas denitrificans]MBY6096740.1 arsenate reductase [Ferrimonas balearica]
MILYGIKSCDTVRKARKHLDAKGCTHTFHDFREAGLDDATLTRWLAQVPYTTLLNTRSTSWRALDDAAKQDLNADKAKQLMLDNPTLVKRPVLEAGDALMVGFKAADYDQWVARHG